MQRDPVSTPPRKKNLQDVAIILGFYMKGMEFGITVYNR